MKIKILFSMLLLISLSLIISCSPGFEKIENRYFNPDLVERPAELIDTLQYRSFLYFINEINPENGLVKDRSTKDSPASIAAVGFAYPIWAIGVDRGWITREYARQLTLNSLRFFWTSLQSTDPLATGYKGFYYHFLDMKNGERVWKCELSTIDTALLLAGIRFAMQFYDGTNPDEKEIRALGDSLTQRIDWDWTTMPDEKWFANSVSFGWHPEQGFIQSSWVGYNEAMILYILAAGSGYSGIEKAWQQWLSHYKWQEPYTGLAHVNFPPLFGHQYSPMFIDYRYQSDNYMQNKGINYFENGQRAVLSQNLYATENPLGWVGYDSLTWGLTACDGPGNKFNTDTNEFRSYSARGANGPNHIEFDDGTIAPTAAASSIIYNPNLVIPTIQNMYQKYGSKGLWRKYGFKDAFNPTAGWFASDYLGIDQGPIVLMIENWRNGFVWKYMMKDPVVKKGLSLLGFTKTSDYPFETAIKKFEQQDKTNPPPKDAVLFVGSSSIRMWKSLQNDMAPIKTINRGFGGSEAEHAIHFFDRIVEPYKPKAIVFYEGDNDIASGKPPVEVLVHFKEFCRQVNQKLKNTPVYFISIKPSIARKKVWPQMQEANALIKEFCDTRQNVFYIDTAAGMLTETGEIRDDIFIKDMLHMNDTGYKIWADLVKAQLQNTQ
ncbi:MAG: hypothetical protein D8M58_02655 [Calditrichaeota bacterium]|nr:MAG: hypothetical protein DWQ03_04425 [Calditrichota bacterium]MBL1204264.1 hypothetical protein [Calditrichota bacterium]NOG44094.1 hypothetical protein [Calditrichota bacterium]